MIEFEKFEEDIENLRELRILRRAKALIKKQYITIPDVDVSPVPDDILQRWLTLGERIDCLSKTYEEDGRAAVFSFFHYYPKREYFPGSLINVINLSEDPRKFDCVMQGLEEYLKRYDIPLRLRESKPTGVCRTLLQICEDGGLYSRFPELPPEVFTVYVTDIRGETPGDGDSEDHNPESFYGRAEKSVIVMVLGGKKDLSSEQIIKATKHEFSHHWLGLGHMKHHEKTVNPEILKFIDLNGSCQFVSNAAISKRSDELCQFHDYLVRLSVCGYKYSLND